MRTYINEKYGITLYNGDCLEVMQTLIEQGTKVDAIITDPPYGMDYKSSRRKQKFDKVINDVDVSPILSKSISLLYEIMKENTAIYMFASWHKVDTFKIAFEKHFNLKNILVWVKNNHGSGDLTGCYAPRHEFVLFGHKGRAINKMGRVADVLFYDKVDGTQSVHPTQKNVEMLERFIKNNADKQELVLDCFMGSGTTGVACINTDRHFIGIELDEHYFDVSIQRIKEAIRIKEAQPMAIFEVKEVQEQTKQSSIFEVME